MSDFQSALDSVLGTLEQIRDGGGRRPRANRSALQALLEPARPRAGMEPGRPRPAGAIIPAESAHPAARGRAGSSAARGRAGSKSERLAEVHARVKTCDLCPHLAQSRTQTVFGTGNPDAELMFIGEAPGADEDAQGEPFVGRAGQLLTKIIAAMGFTREDVYIANVLKSRPDMPPGAPGNRPPTAEEMAHCLPFLIEQINIIQPKVLVALGATAVEGLLGTRGTMRDLRGRWHSFHDTPLMITYHPSYLLRNQSPTEKRKVWEDMLLVLEKLERPISEKQRRYFL